MRAHTRKSQRGAILLMTILILTTLTVLGAGSINFSTIEGDAAVARRQEVFGEACARAIREMLVSQLQLYGVPTSKLTINLPNADDPDSADITLRQGHFSTASAVLDDIRALPGEMSSIGGVSAVNITNSFSTNIPSAPRRMAATCTVVRPDGTLREREIEFVVSYGY